MKKNYLFLTDFYYPKPLANGICAEKIINELSKENNVYVLCYRGLTDKPIYKKDNVTIYKVKTRLFYRLREYSELHKNSLLGKVASVLAKIIQKIKRVIFILFSPLTSPLIVARMYFAAKKICRENNIDATVSIYKPLEIVLTGLLLKKKNVVKYNISYILDTLVNSKINKNLIVKYNSFIGFMWEKIVYKYSDMVINMNCYKELYNNKKYDKYRNKIYFSNIPYIEDNTGKMQLSYDPYKFIYAGDLIKDLRNPTVACETISNCFKDEDYLFAFYSRGNCEDILHSYQVATGNRIVSNGYISKSELDKKLQDAIIITIGNKNSKMISSKVFEYISLNKKIIHFYSDINDSNLEFLKIYPNGLLINEKDDINDNIEKIREFIKLKIIKLNYHDLKKMYEMNTPTYTCNLISDLLKNND